MVYNIRFKEKGIRKFEFVGKNIFILFLALGLISLNLNGCQLLIIINYYLPSPQFSSCSS